MPIDPVVKADNVTYLRDGEPIIERFTFRIDQGQFVGVIGPNGGGKSTLIKLVVGLLRPSSGTLRVFGADPSARSARRRLSYVAQRGGSIDQQFPATVEEVVSSGLAGRSGRRWWLTTPSPTTAVDRALAALHIAHLRHRTLAGISGGERQRALIARALISKPDLLVLDEPSDGLDPESREQLFAILKKIKKERGVTILLVSHDVHAIAREADAALCLKHELVCHSATYCYLKKEALRNAFHTQREEIVAHHNA